MYCKKCNTLLNEETKTCPNCYYDNDLDVEQDKTIELEIIQQQLKQPMKKQNLTPIIIVLLLLVIGFIVIYILNDDDKKEIDDITTTIPITTKEVENSFKYQKLKILYTDNFTVNENSIVYKGNENINIVINEINEDEYNSYISLNECLDSKLNEIDTKTFAEELSYSHVFINNEKFYILKVNYIDDLTIYNENIQLEISNIINTIK